MSLFSTDKYLINTPLELEEISMLFDTISIKKNNDFIGGEINQKFKLTYKGSNRSIIINGIYGHGSVEFTIGVVWGIKLLLIVSLLFLVLFFTLTLGEKIATSESTFVKPMEIIAPFSFLIALNIYSHSKDKRDALKKLTILLEGEVKKI